MSVGKKRTKNRGRSQRRCPPLAGLLSTVEDLHRRFLLLEPVLIVAMVGRHKRPVRARVLDAVGVVSQTCTSHPSGSRRKKDGWPTSFRSEVGSRFLLHWMYMLLKTIEPIRVYRVE